MNITTILQLTIGLILIIYLLFILRKNWNQLPLILLPLIWYLPEQTSEGRIFQSFMYLRWFTVIIIPIIIIVELLRFKTFKVGRILPVISIFVFLSIVSSIVNEIPLIETLGYLAVYLRYPFFFIFLINLDWDEKMTQKFLILFLFLIFIQVPEVLYRHYVLGITGDDISWSLGSWGTTNLGIYSIYATCILISHGLNARFTLWHILGIASFFSFALFGEIKSIVIWLPMAAFLVFYFYPFNTKVKKYSVICIALFIGIIFFQIFYKNWQKLHGKNIASIMQTTYLTLEGEVTAETKYSAYRLGILLQIWERVKTNTTVLLLGEGPGSSLVGNFFGRPGRITQVVANTKDTPNQIASTLLDVGIMGLVLYYLILITILFEIRERVSNNTYNQSIVFNILKTAFPGMIFYYLIIGPMYHPVWRFDAASFIFYFFAAAIYKMSQKEEISNAVKRFRTFSSSY